MSNLYLFMYQVLRCCYSGYFESRIVPGLGSVRRCNIDMLPGLNPRTAVRRRAVHPGNC